MDKITAAEYQKLVRRTAKIGGPTDEQYHWFLGLLGEYSELEREVYPEEGGEIDDDLLADEAGDFLWYAANFAYTCGFPFERVIEGATLLAAWPENKLYDPFRQMASALSAIAEIIKKRDWYEKSTVVISQFHVDRVMAPLLIILNAADLDVENVMARNIAKLKERYPNGFDA